MNVDLFDFELPAERIALRPAAPRDSARMLVVERGWTPEAYEQWLAGVLVTSLLKPDADAL